MKIALEMQPCLKNRSGIGVYTYELSRCLQEYDEIELHGDIFNFLGRNDLSKDLEGIHFNTETYKLFPYGVYRRMWHYLPIKYNHLFKREADLTHFFNFVVPPRIEGKVINTIHDLTFRLYPETMDEKNLKRIKQDIEYSIERSDKIVTISESSKQDMIEYLSVPAEKIEIVYPGVDYARYSQSFSKEQRDQVAAKYGLPERYILYMGTLEPRKNIPSIIEAFDYLKKEVGQSIQDVKLVIVGKKGWLYEGIYNKVETLGLTDEVIFTGYADEADKPILYQLASCFVFPSLYEGFGIPVLEAMAASVPVIASNRSSLPEVVGQAGYLVNPVDKISVSEQMYKMLTDESYRSMLIARGHIQAQKFNWQVSAERLVKLYHSLLD